jgi:hypothetical protein
MKCEVCGKPIEQKARGRRRTTCLGACRTAKYRSKKKPEVILERIPGFVRIRRFEFVDEALMHAASSGYSITLPAELGTALPELGPKDTHLVGRAEAERAPEEVEWRRNSFVEQVERGTSLGNGPRRPEPGKLDHSGAAA